MNALLTRLSFRTAGESHGPGVVAILEGLPRGLKLDLEAVDRELVRRQGGAGRGGRQRMEQDRVEVLAGLRKGVTIGSPLCLLVRNVDHTIDQLPEPTRPRPGHADLAGCYRWLDKDIRSTLERASARETVGRTAAGAVAAQFLSAAGTEVFGFVRSVGDQHLAADQPGQIRGRDLAELIRRRDGSSLYTLDGETDARMLARVRQAGQDRDTVGGVIEVQAVATLPGLGSCLQWHERLDARLAAGIMSIPAIKGIEIGDGFWAATAAGSQVHDPILPESPDGAEPSLPRGSNRAGGLEGGMTNGQNVVVRAAMKPISTLRQPLASVDLATGREAHAGYERSDICAVSAASVVAQAMVALVLADAVLARLGGETLGEVQDRARRFAGRARDLGSGEG